MTTRDHVIECQDLSCGYASAEPVLEHIDLAVPAGEILCIVGPSGSGKSTLLRTILGMLPPHAGRVLVFGEDPYAIDRSGRERLWRRTGTLFQSDALLGSRTVLDNVMLPIVELTDYPEALAIEIARSRLQMMGVGGLEHRLPSDVSGGQRRRIALARAMVTDPEILFCDEPTGGLDPIAAASLNRLLRRLRDELGTTVVVITHEMSTVEAVSDRVVMLHGGEICAEGTFGALRDSDHPDVYAFIHGQVRDEEEAA